MASYVLLRGSAINQDGRSSSLTAPNGPAQQAVVRASMADALTQPADVVHLQSAPLPLSLAMRGMPAR